MVPVERTRRVTDSTAGARDPTVGHVHFEERASSESTGGQ
jgi:hypothetical protein